ncbi:hypothetical protein E2C01_095910 [Portunus trituberculatus]|uniref:Uncharacterized protein n=1 Tax=Portunus trituberculatus TaxID=210409 RepID=A0A5B7K1M7_PORTR|nr:hypothetical protein [Portunus trituberculatus]
MGGGRGVRRMPGSTLKCGPGWSAGV